MTTLEEARAYVVGRGVGLDVARHADLRVGTGDFSGRVVLPWRNQEGHECYLTGRALGRTPKYLHSKGQRPALYASPGAWEAERVALVEGHMDALVCASAGTSAFATAGSSLSDDAVKILASKGEVVLVPDADEAGARWLEQAVEKLSGRVPRMLRATVPEGCKDVTDIAERALSRGEDPAEAAAEVLYSTELVEVPWLTSWGPDTSEGQDGPPLRY